MAQIKYSRKVSKAPQSLAVDGQCQWGTYNSTIPNINILDVKDPLGWPLPQALNYMRLKEWQAFQIDHPDVFILLTVYNAKTLALALVLVYEKKTKQLHRYERKLPFWQVQLPTGLERSSCFYRSSDFNIEIENLLSQDEIKINFEINNFSSLANCSGSFTAQHKTEPIVIVQPFAKNRPLYSHKALMPVQGKLSLGFKKYKMTSQTSTVILDDHKGYYPYVMQYDWVTALGLDSDKNPLGFNLTDNQVINPERYNENCLWQQGRMLPLPPVHFHRPQGVMGQWHVHDEYGMVDIYFQPVVDNQVYLNLALIASRYHGPLGYFEGYIKVPGQKKLSVKKLFGMGEKKYIRM